jgi:hypothetical protein
VDLKHAPFFLRNVASFHPINDTELVAAIDAALASIGFGPDGSMLITQTQKENRYAHAF